MHLLAKSLTKLGMYHRKNGRMDNFMDTFYYKCLLQKMNLFQLKNKLERAKVPDRVRKEEKEAAGGRMFCGKMNGKREKTPT